MFALLDQYNRRQVCTVVASYVTTLNLSLLLSSQMSFAACTPAARRADRVWSSWVSSSRLQMESALDARLPASQRDANRCQSI